MSNEPPYSLEPFFDLSPDLLCIAGFDGYFKRINPAVSALLEYTEEELFSRPINDFVHPDDKHITARFRHSLTQNKPLLNFENRYVKKSGEIVWLSWTSIPKPDHQLVYAIAKNITHKKRLEEQRNTHLEELTRINKDLKQFSYTASHDLRSPVNNLMSVVDLLEMSMIGTDMPVLENMNFVNVLRTAVGNLKYTLDASMDRLADVERLNVLIEEVDLGDCLSGVLHSIQSLVASSGAMITSDFSACKTLRFNRDYMESVFLNLVTNAIKYAQPGITPLIGIRSENNNGQRQLIITDNGRGFDMDLVGDRVFGFHQTFHGHDDSKGIGLYLVYHHVNNLGGQISLKSEPNQGATFTITFRD